MAKKDVYWKEITTYLEAWSVVENSWALMGWFNDDGVSVMIMTSKRGDGRIKKYAERGYKIGNRGGSRVGILPFAAPKLSKTKRG